MPRSHLRPVPAFPRLTKPLAIVATIGLAVGAMQLLPQAGAEGTVITQVASASDSGAVDVNADGVVDDANYGVHSRSLSVGEQGRDGSDLRLFVPFAVSASALAAVKDGGTARVSMHVHRVTNLTRSLVVDASTTTMTATRTGYSRLATHVVTLAPAEGRMTVNVAKVLRSMASPGTLTLRLRLDRPAAVDGARTRVTIATSESLAAGNRPVLTVRSTQVAASNRPPATPTTTTPPAPEPAPTPAAQPAPAPSSPPASTEVFGDEFNGSSLDLSKWRPNWLAGTDDAITKPVNSAELSCYDPAQVSVSGGYLHLRAAARSCRANNGVTYPYASGLVESAHDFTFTYGRIEARIWLPGSGAVANWPAFWANGTGTWPATGELDVMEGLAGNACWHFHSTAGGPGGCAPFPNPAGWHTFAAEWSPGSVTYFYDGTQVGRIMAGITSSPMYLVFNLALSTSIAPPVQVPSEMLVDWVRVTR